MEKSANQRWKESGSNLSFKNWIDLENKRQHNFYKFDATQTVQDSINNTLQGGKDTIKETAGYKSKASTDVLGLNRNVLIFSTAVIGCSIAYYFYKIKRK